MLRPLHLDDLGLVADQTLTPNTNGPVRFGNIRTDPDGYAGSTTFADSSIVVPTGKAGAHLVAGSVYLLGADEPTKGDVELHVSSGNKVRFGDTLHWEDLKKQIGALTRGFWDWLITTSAMVYLDEGEELELYVLNRLDVDVTVIHVPTARYSFADSVCTFGAFPIG